MRLLLMFLMMLICVFSHAQRTVVSLAAFGAVPDDALSDQQAFNAAADYINKREGGVKLVIPAGTYLVGPTYNLKSSLPNIPIGRQWDVLSIKNCTNVAIEGQGKVVIKFLDQIPVGTITQNSPVKDSAVHIGSCIRIENSSGVTIKNLEANGNNEKMRLLRNWGIGANPYEREHDGIFILNSANVTLDNVRLLNFVRDGGIVLQDPGQRKVKKLRFYNCRFDYNGRNGFSWCGGEDVEFSDCTFNYNATGKIVTNPGSGFDIEPERGATCKKAKLTRCSFTNNGGYGVISMYTQAAGVCFDSCTIIGNTNYSLATNSPYFTFNKCVVAGTALFLYNASSAASGTVIKCTLFTDSLKNQVLNNTGYSVSVQGRFTTFTQSRFDNYKVPSVYTEIRKQGGPAHQENTLFKNCVFNAWFTKPATWARWPFLVSNTIFEGCEFNSAGFPDFKNMLNQQEKNIYLRKNTFGVAPIK